MSSSSFVSKTLGQSGIGKKYGVIVLAVQPPSGSMQFNPPVDLQIQDGDVLIAMGEHAKLKSLEQEMNS